MSRSWGRAQTEPLAALAAVVAVGLALSLYAGVLDAELPGSSDRHRADAVSERVESAVAPAGVALPSRIDDGQAAGPTGYRTNVTLRADGRYWSAGPTAPGEADTATTRLGIRVNASRVCAGKLSVRVWT